MIHTSDPESVKNCGVNLIAVQILFREIFCYFNYRQIKIGFHMLGPFSRKLLKALDPQNAPHFGKLGE
jgi:hypothetical protein